MITCSELDGFKLKGNPKYFGKYEDGAAGLREKVQIELHHVKSAIAVGASLCVFSFLPWSLLSSVCSELRLLSLQDLPDF